MCMFTVVSYTVSMHVYHDKNPEVKMEQVALNRQWQRQIGESQMFWLTNTNPAEMIDLPDDYILETKRQPGARSGASSGYYAGGRATYTKRFDVPETWADKTVLLDIDGAYMQAEASLNGEALGIHPYGYTPWQIDLAGRIIFGEENVLEIITRNVQPNSRWYSGGGLYRTVKLYVAEACHIRPWDLFVTTSDVTAESALVSILATITNDGDTAASGTLTAKLGGIETSVEVAIAALSPEVYEFDLVIPDPKLWSADEPNLCELELVLDTNLGVDRTNLSIGIRQIEIDAKQGMRVNGEQVKLRGGCIHHDNTLLGARAYPRAEERKVMLLKEAGYNALRFAHNPPSAAMLDACDRIGMYVIDESFDCWRHGKNDLDYHLFFEDWWERDTAAMVLRDRNHPSIFCWSIGNEIREQGGQSGGAELTRRQADFVRSLDPTRPVMSAIHSIIFSKREKGQPSVSPFKMPRSLALQGESDTDPDLSMDALLGGVMTNNIGDGIVDGEDIWGLITEESASHLDIVGYNYLFSRYARDAEQFPDRVIMGTETHALNTLDYYEATMENPSVIGDFIWTAYDNLGEAGAGRVMHTVRDLKEGMLAPYPWLSCYQGDLDLSGNRRPQSYFRKIMWGLDSGIHVFARDPKLADLPAYGLGWHWNDVWQSWTWDETSVGQPIDVEAYADCDEVEFLINDETVARVPVERLTAKARLIYRPGYLRVLAWKDGEVVAEDMLVTAGKPAKLELLADREQIRADAEDLSFITIRLVDEAGVTVPTDDLELVVEVAGGKLAGLGSGNPCTDENYGTGKRRLWNGFGLAVVRTDQAGVIDVSVKTTDAELEASLRIEAN